MNLSWVYVLNGVEDDDIDAYENQDIDADGYYSVTLDGVEIAKFEGFEETEAFIKDYRKI